MQCEHCTCQVQQQRGFSTASTVGIIFGALVVAMVILYFFSPEYRDRTGNTATDTQQSGSQGNANETKETPSY
jgi:hypothetical protein